MATITSVADALLPSSWSLGEFRLRPLRPGDAPAWHAYLSDPGVIEHTSYPELDLSGVEAMLSRQLEGYAMGTSCRWAVADGTDRLIGTCGFSNWSLPHAHAELVYDLAPAFWGRGVIRAAARQVLSLAFNTARFNRVHAFVMASNAPSIRLLEALGFVARRYAAAVPHRQRGSSRRPRLCPASDRRRAYRLTQRCSRRQPAPREHRRVLVYANPEWRKKSWLT